MILKNLNVRKVIEIKTDSKETKEFIANMIHKQLRGKQEYIESRIILSIGSVIKNIPENDIHVYIFNDCEIDPIIAIGKFNNSECVIINISVRDSIEEEKLANDLHEQLENNRDKMLSNITVHDSSLKKDRDVNGYCVTITYNKERKSTPNIIV